MKRQNFDFVFSSNPKDWMSSSEEREQTRAKYREDNKKRKEAKTNTGTSHLRMMNDNMRAV
jgi:hypothetical protein